MENSNHSDRMPVLFGSKSLKTIITITFVAHIILTLLSFIGSVWQGLIMVVVFLIAWGFGFRFVNQYHEKLDEYIMNLSFRIKRGEQEAIIKMPMGIILYNDDLEIEWINPYMQNYVNDVDNLIGKSIGVVHESILDKIVSDKELDQYGLIDWGEKTYHYEIQKGLKAVYLLDVTEYVAVKKEYEHYKPVIGWLFLDNYDEAVKDLDDREVSALDSLLTTYLSRWAKNNGIFYKKTSSDRFLIILSYSELKTVEENKFNIIDYIRERTSKRNVPLTISIGLAYGEDSFNNLADLAQKNLDLALGRGGDQAVVKEVGYEPRYYGGKTNPTEKRTRVRSRMISQALQELIIEANSVYIMGHANPDMDAIGSSFGIARIAMMLEQEAQVVINPNDLANDVQKLIKETEKYSETYDNIVTPKEAAERITEEDIVILVDHHKPTLSIAPELLNKTKRNVVIDHHRRGEEFTENPLLVYIEPYASSTAELITEFFEYVPVEGNPINKIEATALLGGIIVDTNNFSLRTGSRTFNSASYLQSVGANITLIQRLLKEDKETYLERSELFKTIEFAKHGCAIAVGSDDQIHHPVTAAQTADEMLNMTDVEASFVITKRAENTVGISARSLGKINVQLIMEEMGGGGHLSNAATQIDSQTIQEVKDNLIDIINSLDD